MGLSLPLLAKRTTSGFSSEAPPGFLHFSSRILDKLRLLKDTAPATSLAPGPACFIMEPQMRRAVWIIVGLLLLTPLVAQRNARLPNGKSRAAAVLKNDLKKSREDVAEIITLARDLEDEIDENQEFVVDVRSLRKAEKIEALARRIKNRLRRRQ